MQMKHDKEEERKQEEEEEREDEVEGTGSCDVCCRSAILGN
jgi:hypothetical protein